MKARLLRSNRQRRKLSIHLAVPDPNQTSTDDFGTELPDLQFWKKQLLDKN
ncbi:hypothetical protein DSO57_1013661 [Entomophthora muscae]|uniref:Uncharacterized protein n=1 Tax=Entomophthora muscae TaxID=34485 RepID=A0ACC2T5M0_9FUNG|nr:hypothetical protein DSO57_1013661 [Entomophthora muscae]